MTQPQTLPSLERSFLPTAECLEDRIKKLEETLPILLEMLAEMMNDLTTLAKLAKGAEKEVEAKKED